MPILLAPGIDRVRDVGRQALAHGVQRSLGSLAGQSLAESSQLRRNEGLRRHAVRGDALLEGLV